jgi:hypothetical protein
MKRKLLLVGLVPVMMLAAVPTAKALNPEWAVALGALGGFILSENFGTDRVAACPVETPTITMRDVYYERHYPSSYFASSPRCGHYEYVERRIWVPGRYFYVKTGCNRYRRHWEEGYYRTENVRVWVRD